METAFEMLAISDFTMKYFDKSELDLATQLANNYNITYRLDNPWWKGTNAIELILHQALSLAIFL